MMAPLLELSHVSKTFGSAAALAPAHARGGRCELRSQAGAARNLHHRWPVRQRQDHACAHDPRHGDADGGSIRLLGQDLAHIRGDAARAGVHGAVQPIFQNPFEAFNPLRQLDHYLFLTARRFGDAGDGSEAQTSTDTALRQVGPVTCRGRRRYPHELSGGQLQRHAIARALLPKPKLIVADEPVSMVDASLRMAIVNLFKTLRDELGISIIYITHDLATAYYISDRIMIMERKVVESGDARNVLAAPQHAYSRQLKDAVLVPQFTQPASGQ